MNWETIFDMVLASFGLLASAAMLYLFVMSGKENWKGWKLPRRQVELLAQQVAILRETNKLLRRLAEKAGA
jgi:hypothetical protein